MRKTTILIVGKHAVIEALKNPSRKIERVFLTEDAQKKLNRENQSLNLLKNINVFYNSRKELCYYQYPGNIWKPLIYFLKNY